MKVPVIYPERCTGCKVCEIVCSLRKRGFCQPNISRIKVTKSEKLGLSFPSLCMQCLDPPCMDACPVEAIFKDPKTGAIQIDDEICVGCRACTVVCPFGAIFISEEKKIAVVCDMCGGDPECVKWCPKDAIKFVEEKQVNRFVKRVRLEKMTETMLEARSKILEKFPKY